MMMMMMSMVLECLHSSREMMHNSPPMGEPLAGVSGGVLWDPGGLVLCSLGFVPSIILGNEQRSALSLSKMKLRKLTGI